MNRTMRKIIVLVITMILTLVAIFGVVVVASAQTIEQDNTIKQRRVFETISLSINSGDGKVWAFAKHEFSLFSSTVAVSVELYRSDAYCESYKDMTFMARTTATSLPRGNSVTCSASTDGKSSYWQARLRYRIGNGDWVEKTTATCHIDGDGNLLQ